MNILKYKYIIFILISIGLGGCSKQHGVKNKYEMDIYDQIIFFPTEIKLINSYCADSIDFNIASIKIVHWFDADCSICVKELKNYQKMLEEYNNLTGIETIFIASTMNYHLLDYMLEQNQICLPIYHDKRNEFFSKNNLIADKKYHSFIVNECNEIVFTGNPLANERLHLNFIEKLESLLNQGR